MITIGLISDTHGMLRPQALAALAGSDHLIHAGDIGDASILDELRRLAPVTAVRGNNDRGPWARDLPDDAVVELGGLLLYVLHDMLDLSVDLVVGGFAAVVTGHSHKPTVDRRSGVLLVNPGSAGPRRFTLPISVGRLWIEGGRVDGEIVILG